MNFSRFIFIIGLGTAFLTNAMQKEAPISAFPDEWDTIMAAYRTQAPIEYNNNGRNLNDLFTQITSTSSSNIIEDKTSAPRRSMRQKRAPIANVDYDVEGSDAESSISSTSTPSVSNDPNYILHRAQCMVQPEKRKKKLAQSNQETPIVIAASVQSSPDIANNQTNMSASSLPNLPALAKVIKRGRRKPRPWDENLVILENLVTKKSKK